MSKRNGDSNESIELYNRHLKIMKQITNVSSSKTNANPCKTKFKNLPTVADYKELRKAYKFLMPQILLKDVHEDSSLTMTWQERMARQYHSHLFKSYAIADLSQVSLKRTSQANKRESSRIGLRWRIEREVQEGIGQFTCGNKHCPSFRTIVPYNKNCMETYFKKSNQSTKRTSRESRDKPTNLLSKYGETVEEEEEEERNVLEEMFLYGMGLHSYEVNFQYVEDNTQKNELVKLRLCMRCAPLLFATKGGALGAKKARENDNVHQGDEQTDKKLQDSFSSKIKKENRLPRKKEKRKGRYKDKQDKKQKSSDKH